VSPHLQYHRHSHAPCRRPSPRVVRPCATRCDHSWMSTPSSPRESIHRCDPRLCRRRSSRSWLPRYPTILHA